MDDGDDQPLSDIARRVERRRSEAADADDEESPFESIPVEEVDSEALWAGLVEADDGSADSDADAVAAGGPAERVEAASPDDVEHVVPKSEFCQRCPHFADPPEFACTREGTEIVELAAADRFRVRNCPVADDREGRPESTR